MDTIMMNHNAPIGVFDSGSGGLTVLRVLQKQFPHEQFVYYADTANLPYGTKSPAEIVAFTRAACTWLQNVAQVKMIVIACNTSSALALDAIKGEFSVPLVGTIYPLIHTLLTNHSYKNIGIIATPAAAQSKMHATILKAHGFTGIIETIPCPDFVPLIEAQKRDTAAIQKAAHVYLEPFYTKQLDTLIYGCTHYPLIAGIIESLLPPTMQYIDPAYAMAKTVGDILNENKLYATNLNTCATHYYCTKDPELFAQKCAQIMNRATNTTLLVNNHEIIIPS